MSAILCLASYITHRLTNAALRSDNDTNRGCGQYILLTKNAFVSEWRHEKSEVESNSASAAYQTEIQADERVPDVGGSCR